MLEREIEAYLVKRVKEMDGVAYKFTSPSRRSVPDRIVVMKGKHIFFVEVKNTVGRLTDGQKREIEKLRDMGQRVFVCYSKEQVDEILHEVTGIAK